MRPSVHCLSLLIRVTGYVHLQAGQCVLLGNRRWLGSLRDLVLGQDPEGVVYSDSVGALRRWGRRLHMAHRRHAAMRDERLWSKLRLPVLALPPTSLPASEPQIGLELPKSAEPTTPYRMYLRHSPQCLQST